VLLVCAAANGDIAVTQLTTAVKGAEKDAGVQAAITTITTITITTITITITTITIKTMATKEVQEKKLSQLGTVLSTMLRKVPASLDLAEPIQESVHSVLPPGILKVLDLEMFAHTRVLTVEVAML